MRAIRKQLHILTMPFFLVACAEVGPEADVVIGEGDDSTRSAEMPRDRAKVVLHADAIDSRYIVVLESSYRRAEPGSPHDLAELDATIERLTAGRTAHVHERYGHALRGFVATLTDADARALAYDPEVAYVEQDARVYPADAEVQSPATWGIDRIDQPSLPLDDSYTYLASGTGVTAYVLDSGIRATHGEFTGRILPGYTSINDGQGTNDCNQHGTHVAGTVAGTVLGVAKRANIVPVRLMDCEGGSSLSSIVSAIDWVIANKQPQSVANMSIGIPPTPAVDAAVQNLINAGVTVIVSAGNDTVDACLQSPARVPAAITVAATGMTDARATFSNFGSCVDLHAPGVDIRAASVAGDTLARVLSGTSMAAPHVTGAVALYLETHPTATPAEVTQALLAGTTADQVTDLRGSPDRLLATHFVDSTPPAAAISSPADGAEVTPSFTVTATASDPNLVRVALSIDGIELEARTEGPFTFQVTGLALGEHVVELVALDAAQLETTSTIQITVVEAGGPQDPADPGTPGELGGGCSAGGGATGWLVMLALVALRRRRR